MSPYKKLADVVDRDIEESDTGEVAKVAKVANLVELQGVSHAKVMLKHAKVAAKVPRFPQQAPCSVCGGTDRWEDDSIWRCVTCWPHPITRKTCEAERAYQHSSRRPRT